MRGKIGSIGFLFSWIADFIFSAVSGIIGTTQSATAQSPFKSESKTTFKDSLSFGSSDFASLKGFVLVINSSKSPIDFQISSASALKSYFSSFEFSLPKIGYPRPSSNNFIPAFSDIAKILLVKFPKPFTKSD